MFKKTRRKIVFTVVGSLLLLMSVTLATIYISNRIAISQENETMLKMYVQRYSLEDRPDDTPDDPPDDLPENGKPDTEPNGKPTDRPDLPDDKNDPRNKRERNEPQFQLSTFYSVAYSSSGEVLAIQNDNSELKSEEELLDTASSILKSGKTEGTAGGVSYLVKEYDGYTLVAMIDETLSDSSQQTLIRLMLIIGSVSLSVLFVVSIFIARKIVSPLEENDKRQKRFVSDAGHELKTPIAVISANSELLRRQVGDREWLDNIDYENERMSDLVKQLLLLSKAENRDLPKETLDLSKLVSGEVLHTETLAYENGKRIISDIEPALMTDGNPAQLCQLVSILLDNAISHGTGEEIELSLHKDHHFASLTVSNEAAKLSADQLSHLFDRFYRKDAARTASDSQHYGLGLSIAQAVVESHNGVIKAEYKNGKAVFTVALPAKKA